LINIMLGKKLIAVFAIWIFCLGMSQALGKGANFQAVDSDQSEGPAFGFLNLEAKILAQNDKTASEDSDKSIPGSETDESEAAAEDEKKSSEDRPKPLKPFVPSEKIPGEQAVDFPVDI
jgi:hypothetical protein